MESIKLFYGLDPREAVGTHVFLQSLFEKTSVPVEAIALTPKLGESLGIKEEGTNSFGKLRFLVPYLCNFRGYAIWADGADMLLRADLKELWDLRDSYHGVKVVKHDYQTKSVKKYIGTLMESKNEDYPMKNWSSLILWWCGFAPHWGRFRNSDEFALTPEFIARRPSSYLHRFSWIQENRIGDLPKEWNHLVGEESFNPAAKLAHFTCGIPGFEHYKNADYADEWVQSLTAAAQGLQPGSVKLPS